MEERKVTKGRADRFGRQRNDAGAGHIRHEPGAVGIEGEHGAHASRSS